MRHMSCLKQCRCWAGNTSCTISLECVQKQTPYVTHFKVWVIHFQGLKIHDVFPAHRWNVPRFSGQVLRISPDKKNTNKYKQNTSITNSTTKSTTQHAKQTQHTDNNTNNKDHAMLHDCRYLIVGWFIRSWHSLNMWKPSLGGAFQNTRTIL